MRKSLLISVVFIAGYNQYISGQSSARGEAEKARSARGIIYRNPRVYNVDCRFEMFPDPNSTDRTKDLKVWLPGFREWESQKAIKIISVKPEPHGRYVDPEYGNPMVFWDFGKMSEQPFYKVDIKFRLESYDVSVKVDPNRVGSYDKTSKEYALYTRSTRTIHITPKIRELAQEAIGNEKNPYLQAKRIVEFANNKVRYKILDYERGRGIDVLLAYPIIDEKTGQEYYEGCCNQIAALMVAMCRAVGIPARCVSLNDGWCPWIEPNNVKAKFPFETKLSPDGLAATRFHGGLHPHMWGEFFIPNYGWIPTELTVDKTKHHVSNTTWITSKGRDVLLGPGAPPENNEGYGAQWVALHDGRADCLGTVLNIAKIHDSRLTVTHYSDPFPADGLASYPEECHPLGGAEKELRRLRQDALSWPSYLARSSVPDNLNVEQFYKDHPRAKEYREFFVCHMLRRQLGDEVFFKLVKKYVNLRQKSGKAVPTNHFQKLAENISGQSLDWFFDQWVNTMKLPRLKLDEVSVRKRKEDWHVRGRLLQSGDKVFRLPIELALDVKHGREIQKFWMDSKVVDFDFHTPDEPLRLIVDPDYEVLKIQKMPPRLWWFWDFYSELIIVYGTFGDTDANKTAAKRFNYDLLGLGDETIKADTDVNEADLKTKCVVLIGRPETNKVAQQFKDAFPIRFNGKTFTRQGITYAQPTQGVIQMIENPNDAQGLMIMCAGLSPEAILRLCDPDFTLTLYNSSSSYVILDGNKQLLTGNWEDVDSNLYWNFN